MTSQQDPQNTSRTGDGELMKVIVTCGERCEEVTEELRNAGISVTNIERMLVGSVDALVTHEQLQSIRTIPGVIAVEPDEEVKAL